MAMGNPLIVQWMAEWLVPGQAEQYVTMLNTEADPLVMAAWVGLLVTGLNMMPIGQLDGGHVAFGRSRGFRFTGTAIDVAGSVRVDRFRCVCGIFSSTRVLLDVDLGAIDGSASSAQS
jgi:hypothetical protein